MRGAAQRVGVAIAFQEAAPGYGSRGLVDKGGVDGVHQASADLCRRGAEHAEDGDGDDESEEIL